MNAHLFPLPHNNNFANVKSTIKKKITKIIENRKDEKTNPDGFRDLLSLMIDASDEEGNNFSTQELIDESMTFLFAGHDTTSSSLSYLFYQLTKNPNIQQEVYDEIKENLKEGEPNFENIKQLNLLHYCTKESLRIAPPIVHLPRVPNKDEDIMGYAIPKDTPCALNVIGLHYSEKYWENPEEFIPRRWETIDDNKVKFCYFPFSVGHRDCAGKSLAYVETDIVSSIIQKYEIKFPKGFDPSVVELELVLGVKLKNLRIEFVKRI
eukprot:gene8290-114_t